MFLGSRTKIDSGISQHEKSSERLNKYSSSGGSGSLKIRCNKQEIFLSSCFDISNTLENRLRSDMIKREEQRIWEVRNSHISKFEILYGFYFTFSYSIKFVIATLYTLRRHE